MVTKETFVKSLNFVKEFDESIRNAESNLGISVDWSSPLYVSQSYIIDLLTEAMSDSGGWVRYYTWETNFGEDWKDNSVTIDCEPVRAIKTPEALYDFIIQFENEKPGVTQKNFD